MRLKPPPPDTRVPWHGAQADLLRALSVALSAVGVHEQTLARAMSDLGAIDLPDGAPNQLDTARLQAAGPLYFAGELEAAGVLRCAELVAGLFASGTISQPLGPVAQSINTFWRARRERLEAVEREAIFERVLEPPHFDRLMTALCSAIVAQADGHAPSTGPAWNMREGVALSMAAQSLAEFLAQRIDPMASIAARDLVDTINAALGFLRDRMLQSAFGVHSLWALVAVEAQSQGTGATAGDVQRHAERGRAGQAVLLWLARNFGGTTVTLDPGNAADIELIMSAQRWLDAERRMQARQSFAATNLPIAA